MDSIKTKTKNFSTINHKAIAQVVLVAEKGYFRVYVAWEWTSSAEKGFFAIMKSQTLEICADKETINRVCDFGQDITETAEAKLLFKNML